MRLKYENRRSVHNRCVSIFYLSYVHVYIFNVCFYEDVWCIQHMHLFNVFNDYYFEYELDVDLYTQVPPSSTLLVSLLLVIHPAIISNNAENALSCTS